MTTLNQLKSSAYLSKSVQGQIDCSYHGMGGDPLGGYYKYCLCKPEQAHVCADDENKVCSCNGLVFYGKKYVSNKPGSGAMTTLNQLKSSAYLSKSVQGQIDCSYHGM